MFDFSCSLIQLQELHGVISAISKISTPINGCFSFWFSWVVWKSSLDGDWVNDTKCDKCYCKFVSIPFLIRWAVSCWLHLKFNWRKCLQRLSTVISRTNSKSHTFHWDVGNAIIYYHSKNSKFRVWLLLVLPSIPLLDLTDFGQKCFSWKLIALNNDFLLFFVWPCAEHLLSFVEMFSISLHSILIVQHNLCSGLGPNQWTDSWDPFSLCCYVFVANVICRHSYALHAYQFMHFSNMDICVCCTLKHAQCAHN